MKDCDVFVCKYKNKYLNLHQNHIKLSKIGLLGVKEITFIRNNIDKWQRAEIVIDDAPSQSPDLLAEVYTDLTADLAFAQTHYPDSRITLYLNKLCSVLHNSIYRNKREKWSRVLTFWTQEVPLVMYDARKLLLASFLIFMTSVFVGVLSQCFDSEFCRIILGDYYVDMTLDNIAKGKPMAVYDGEAELDMFLGITFNNIRVSFYIFAAGVLTSISSGYLLFQNGIMLGCFQTFFIQQGLFTESFLAIFLHGTLEISAIIIAGAAGLAVGNSWLSPGTYSRLVSFRMGAKRGMKIIVGTIPIFIVAGFVESYLTRHTEVPNAVRLTFIILSLVFIIGYFVVLPIIRNRKSKQFSL